VGRFRRRLIQREDDAAVGGRDRHGPLARFDLRVVGDPEAQRIHEEADAPLQVADVDVDGVDAEEGVDRPAAVAHG
jgi:hypothetical protein